ncbi:hypothetical protein quinque_010689 [Culex quinquefasciatus]
MSVCSSDRFRQQALRRAKFKLPSRRKIFIWKKWGFTKYDRDQHQVYWDEVYLVSDGCGVKFFNDHGPLKNREAYERARLAKVLRGVVIPLRNQHAYEVLVEGGVISFGHKHLGKRNVLRLPEKSFRSAAAEEVGCSGKMHHMMKNSTTYSQYIHIACKWGQLQSWRKSTGRKI